MSSCKDLYDKMNKNIEKIEQKAENDPELLKMGQELERDFNEFKSKCMK